MAIAAPELAAIVAASRPAPAPASAGAGGAQVVFGLLLLCVGIFLAWLFATGRLKAVQTAIATGVAPSALIPAANPAAAATGGTSSSPSVSGASGLLAAPAQAGGVGSVGVNYNPATGSLTATPALALNSPS
jgi:hypothetical protein